MLAELKGHSEYFAIKCQKKHTVIEDDDVESTMIERKVLALGGSHPLICKLFCTFQTRVSLLVVLPLKVSHNCLIRKLRVIYGNLFFFDMHSTRA